MKRNVKRHVPVQPLDKPYRFIPLTQGQNAIVDVEDFEWLAQFNWFAYWAPCTKSFYAKRHITGGNQVVSMEAFILGCKSKQEGDHKNHDTLDNRRRNLRKCTPAQNRRNRKMPCTNSSGYKGVSWFKPCRKWMAYIAYNGKQVNLGLFDLREDAAKAYDKASKAHHGEFGYRNFK